ncbi:hypothetical protein BU17DRAFT_70352 [Hysterangium stoloniferum]|nr:hypothetical protein BU17DRAFT_70352 [Hysterangium stoloniferum]
MNTAIIAMQLPSGAMDQDGEHGVTLTTGPMRSAGAGGHRQGWKAGHVARSGPNEKLMAAMGPYVLLCCSVLCTQKMRIILLREDCCKDGYGCNNYRLKSSVTAPTLEESHVDWAGTLVRTIWVPTLKYTASDMQITGVFTQRNIIIYMEWNLMEIGKIGGIGGIGKIGLEECEELEKILEENWGNLEKISQ